MKKLSFAALTMALGLAWSVQAADSDPGKELSPAQQQQRAELIKKYDANKDGVLDSTEFKKMSKDDKKALAKLGGVGTARNADEKSKEGQKGEPSKGEKGKGRK